MENIPARRRRGMVPKSKRLNIFLAPDTFQRVQSMAILRGVENGAVARQLIEERLNQLAGKGAESAA